MKRILLFLSLFLTAFTGPAQDKAILDFELRNAATSLPQGWYIGVGGGTTGKSPAKWAMDSLVKKSGRYSLSAESESKDDFISAVHSIRKTYDANEITLKGYLKTEGVTGKAGLWMRVDGKDGTVLQFNNMMDQPVSGTTDWKEYSITLPYDRSAAWTINVGTLLIGSGKIWVDDFKILLNDGDISAAAEHTRPSMPADNDTAFNAGSGLSNIILTKEKEQALTKLGHLWGFLKYYHAGVQEGQHNMDAALFRVLPQLLQARTSDAADTVLERWVDGFGKPAACTSCKKGLEKMKDVTQKPDYGPLFNNNYFPASLTEKLKYIRDNRTAKSGDHYYIDLAPQVLNPQFLNEEAYQKHLYPDAGLRLLALYRYWNMIQYFFPYRHLIGEDWNAVLPAFIPEFVNTRDTMAYQLATLKLIARIHDTHGQLRGGDKLPDAKGILITPFHARFIEDKLVVTGYYKDTLGVQNVVSRGDVIQAIDGVSVADLVKRCLPLTPGSNYPTQLREMASYGGFLLRSHSPQATLRVLRAGEEKEVTIPRIPVSWNMWGKEEGRNISDVGYKKLEGNIGYLYPVKLSDASLDSVKALLKDTKALVIDLRCYPSTFMPFTYGAWLKPKASAFVKFTNGSLDWPGAFSTKYTLKNGGGKGDKYKGKVIILVNETTQSQAEYTAMALQTVPGAVTIGSTTAGADGNVSEIILPGGLSTWISGINVLYPDGTETQRAGVKINKVVKPTIAGIRAGKDEVLEEALRMANN